MRGHYQRNKDVYKARAALRKKRLKAEIDLVKSVPCLDCGGTFPPCVMDFDHRDGEVKVGNIANMFDGAKQKLLDEIAKCDIICSNCHRLRTYNRQMGL